jgi:signal peptide peptidase SppA
MAEQAAADPTIEKVLLDIASPGGSVTGVPETGAALARLAERKPVAAWTDSVMASAAYWFGSQAGTIIASPSSRVGSIGVYSIFTDRSGFLEKLGMKVNAISAGKYKLAGAPFKPMEDEERALFQASVDKIRDQFHGAVNAKRSLKQGSMEGQCFDGEDAHANNLVDHLAHSVDEVIAFALR